MIVITVFSNLNVYYREIFTFKGYILSKYIAWLYLLFIMKINN